MEGAQILDGKVLAAKLRSKVAASITELQGTIPGFKPHLSIVQVSTHYARGRNGSGNLNMHRYALGLLLKLVEGMPAL